MSPAVSTIMLLTLVVIATASVTDKEWREFKAKHGKQYEDSATEQHRRDVYSKNKERIRAHNERFRNNQTTFTIGVNKFTDMTFEEFSEKMLMKPRPVRTSGRHQKLATLEGEDYDVTVPDTVDWREQRYVSEVKDQLDCGSCWAFSAVGSLEGQNAKKTGEMVTLSEQNLLDCVTTEFGNYGCRVGGFVEGAFEYIMEKEGGGIDTEDSYQYVDYVGTCSYDQGNSGATISGYQKVEPSGDEEALKQAVASVGPISACIYVTESFKELYGNTDLTQEIYHDLACNSPDTNHCITIIGYGTDPDSLQDYWLIKNSWGEEWGNKGYLKMARNQNNNCLIASQASYPLM